MTDAYEPDSNRQPPLPDPSPEPSSVPPLADKTARFVTYVIDYLMLGVFVFILVSLIAFIGGEGAIDRLQNIPSLVLSIAAILMYYVTLESLFGKTVGKMIIGTRVVDINCRHPDFSRIVIRTCCRLIPFEQFSFLFGRGRGWHDSLSGTYVINTRSA